ncbi:MAG: response regulator transcription factor [Calditrichia bacterium]
MIRVCVVDDHTLIREGFKKLLSAEDDFQVDSEASSAEELLNILQEKQIDVVVLDISLPDKNGLELLSDLKFYHPDLKILILSMHSEDRFARRALKEGASGYITKETAGDVLVKAVRKVAAGGKYLSANLAETLAAQLASGTHLAKHEQLSGREFQVLRQLATGKSIREIGDELNLSPKTVSTYRKRLLQKLGFSSNAEITRYAIQQGLLNT